MSGGRWVRENNGDYQHYTDEEYAEQQRAKLGIFFGVMLVGGPVLMFLFNEMLWGAIVTLVGVVGLFIVPGYTIGSAVGCGIILGVILYFANYGEDKKEGKKEDNKEAISAPPTNQNTLVTYWDWNVVHTRGASLSQTAQSGNLQNEEFIGGRKLDF